jgi:hypothetical protein
MKRILSLGILAVLLTALPLLADDDTQQAPPPPAGPADVSGPNGPGSDRPVPDAPGRVARLQYMSGQVSIQPRGVEDWVQGSANRPLTNADNVWTDKDSRAELSVGTGFMRMDSESSLTLANINNDAVQVELHQGTLNVHIKKLYGGEIYEIDSPNLAFTVLKAGDYRFDVDPTGNTTRVTVWKGEGQASGKGNGIKLKAGKTAEFSGDTTTAFQEQDAGKPDGFDQWCDARDQRADNSPSARYVAPGVVGAQDLDAYGSWQTIPPYGPVWVPASVPPGWAPYRYGHWVYISPWGWTWVDDAPWGFAPFHYGRWVYAGYGWGWVPGPYYVRPWYAPAMVGWFGGPGWGVGWGFGFGFGFGVGWGWGWAPLGWHEPFAPWWGRCSPGYFRNVNISNTNITNINHVTNVYNQNGANGFYGHNGIGMPTAATTHGGLTAASNNTLQHSLPVQNNMGKVPESALNHLSSTRPSASPTHDSMTGDRASTSAHPSSAAASRPTMSKMTPPAAPARTNGAEGSHGAENSTARTSENGGTHPAESAGEHANSMSSASHMSNNVPHPPNATPPNGTSWGSHSSTASESHNSGASEAAHGENSQMAMNHTNNVPRPPEGNFSRPAISSDRSFGSSSSAGSSRSYSSAASGASRGGSYGSVPRPSGSVPPAPQQYANNYGSSRSYGNSSGYRGYGSNSSNYWSSRGYGSYGSNSYGHYSSPSSHSYGGSHSSSSGGYHGSSGGGHSGGGGGHH